MNTHHHVFTFALLSAFLMALQAANDAVPAPTRTYVACSGTSGNGGGASTNRDTKRILNTVLLLIRTTQGLKEDCQS